jgi:Phosphotransferase enzyme family
LEYERDSWIAAHSTPTGPVELVCEHPWSTVLRTPVEGGAVWFKACGPVQAFEAGLTAALAARSDLLPRVLAVDETRAWLLLADAGTPLTALGDRLEAWLSVLPRYAELQIDEARHVAEHLAAGVPDRRVETLPAQFEALAARGLVPSEAVPRFAALCAELDARGPAPTIQHDDLHAANVYARDGRLTVLDWGDACVSHPFFSLVATMHNEADRVPIARLRDAYLEPWGGDVETFELALRVGWGAYAIAWLRQYDHLRSDDERADFMREFTNVLQRAYSAAA